MIDTCIIRKVQAFSSLSDETISKISKIAVDVTLKKGETLFWERIKWMQSMHLFQVRQLCCVIVDLDKKEYSSYSMKGPN